MTDRKRGSSYGDWIPVEDGEIHTGGQGTVFLVRRDRDDLTAVLKLFVTDGLHEAEAAEAWRSFSAERDLLKSLNHPNVADYLDSSGDELGIRNPWIVTKLVGTPGAKRVGYGPPGTLDAWSGFTSGLTQIQLLQVVNDCCRAVEYLHGQDPPVVHRDLKPTNFLCEEVGRKDLSVWLCDFALATTSAESTAPGKPPGTPGFLAPELEGGGSATTASDVYALGCTLRRAAESIYSRGQVPAEVGAVLGLAASDAPAERPSATELRKQLEKALNDNPPKVDEAFARSTRIR